MRLLISNDDGIYSPGIAVLAEVASRFGEVRIVAPDVEQSSMAQAITANRPLTYRRTPLKNFRCLSGQWHPGGLRGSRSASLAES